MQVLTESVGIFTSRGAAAWAVAAAAAYVYFVVPQQREEREAMVRTRAFCRIQLCCSRTCVALRVVNQVLQCCGVLWRGVLLRWVASCAWVVFRPALRVAAAHKMQCKC